MLAVLTFGVGTANASWQPGDPRPDPQSPDHRVWAEHHATYDYEGHKRFTKDFAKYVQHWDKEKEDRVATRLVAWGDTAFETAGKSAFRNSLMTGAKIGARFAGPVGAATFAYGICDALHKGCWLFGNKSPGATVDKDNPPSGMSWLTINAPGCNPNNTQTIPNIATVQGCPFAAGSTWLLAYKTGQGGASAVQPYKGAGAVNGTCSAKRYIDNLQVSNSFSGAVDDPGGSVVPTSPATGVGDMCAGSASPDYYNKTGTWRSQTGIAYIKGDYVQPPGATTLTPPANADATLPSGATEKTGPAIPTPPAAPDPDNPWDTAGMAGAPAGGTVLDQLLANQSKLLEAMAEDHVAQPAPGTTAPPDTGADETADERVVVPAPKDHEKYEDYAARLRRLRLVPVEAVLSETTMDTAYGPKEVVKATPGPGSKLTPGTEVSVQRNPDTAPTPAGSSDGPGPDIPAINLQPLAVPQLCNKFPFGIPCWVNSALGGMGAGASSAPRWTIPTVLGSPLVIDLAKFQSVVDIVKPIFLFGGILGMGWMFMGLAMGRGGGGDD